jgi:mono/diheme cytochrome c family protein
MTSDTRFFLSRMLAVSVLAGLLAVGMHAARGRADGRVAAGGHRRQSRHNFSYAALEHVPQKARRRRNPLGNNPHAAAAGKKLFQEHCAQCHGATAEGGRVLIAFRMHKAPGLTSREVREAPPGAIFWILSNGIVRRGMPDWSSLPPAARWQIVTYLKSLSTRKRKAPSPVRH